MPSDKARELLNEAARLEQIHDAKEGLAEDIVALVTTHTAQAIQEAVAAERAMCDRLAEALGKAISEVEVWIEFAPEEAEYSEMALMDFKNTLIAYTAHKEGR